MHNMQTIAIDDPGVCKSVCHEARRGFVMQKRLGVLDRGPAPPRRGEEIRCGLRQITLSTHLLFIKT